MNANTPDFYGPMMRPKAAAAYIGIGVSTYWKLVRLGKLAKPTKISSRIALTSKSTLDCFIARQAAEVAQREFADALGFKS